MKNKITTLVLVGAVLAGVYLIAASSPLENSKAVIMEGMKATVYKSPSCGCCDNYIGYLRRYGLEVERIATDEMEGIKDQFGVPHEVMSCHTMAIGGYTVEGHIPLEVVAKLLEEKPNIKGIALAGMPSGSPGMAGAKLSPFGIKAVGNGGEISSFMDF